jgi:hypothetical protein
MFGGKLESAGCGESVAGSGGKCSLVMKAHTAGTGEQDAQAERPAAGRGVTCCSCGGQGGAHTAAVRRGSGARRSGSQSAQSWPIWVHLGRDCERPAMPMNIWLPVTPHSGELCHVPRCSSCPVFTRNLQRSSGTAGEQTANDLQ